MTTAHDSRTASREAGFSMIDVLVAIVVLTVGLLALGVLQAGLTRNAADSRARSQLAAFSEGLIEQARSNGYDAIASVTIQPKANGTVVERAAEAAQTAAGISNLKTVQTATTYYADAAGKFTTTPPTGGASVTTPQYKKLDIVTTWTDASGTSRTLTLNTIVSDIIIKDDKSPFNQQLGGPTNSIQRPIVRQDTPTGPGVIPVAMGNGSDTAATNPKPEISAKSGKIDGTTSYNVLTYHKADEKAEIQRRVETLVVSCSCKFGAANQATGVFAQPYRPTYWDGNRYVPPQPTKSEQFPQSNAAAPPAAGEDPRITKAQSPYCTECCRDHHDSSDAKVKFDALRTNFGKYTYDASGNLVASSDNYLNACRLIRVDGIFRTATDLQNNHMGLLATAVLEGKTQPATSPVPKKDYADLYSGFVLDYLRESYVTENPPAVPTVDADAIYTTKGLKAPESLDLTRVANDIRYLHARGLYVDHLEEPTIAAIQRNCKNANLTSDCVLPMLPFTTINTTELTDWAPGAENAGALQVLTAPTCKDPTGLTNPNVDFPIRGCAAAGIGSGAAYAVAEMGRSNAGVAIARSVDPQDNRLVRTAQQKFVVPDAAGGGSGGGGSGGGGSGGGGTGGGGGTVMVSWTGPKVTDYNTSTYPLVSWRTSTGQLGCANSAAKNKSDPNPYTCMPSSLTDVAVTVGAPPVGSPGGYNTTVYVKDRDPCANGNTDIPHCPKYKVDSVSVNGISVTPAVTVVGTPGALSEGSTMTFASLAASAKIIIGLKQVNSGNDQAGYVCVDDPNHANKKITQWIPCTP